MLVKTISLIYLGIKFSEVSELLYFRVKCIVFYIVFVFYSEIDY